MIYTHSIERAVRCYPQQAALNCREGRCTFAQLHQRVGSIAALLLSHGIKRGERLAIFLPNQPEYIQFIYACSWLGVIAVPLNTRLSAAEIDSILSDATPRGLIRHSS